MIMMMMLVMIVMMTVQSSASTEMICTCLKDRQGMLSFHTYAGSGDADAFGCDHDVDNDSQCRPRHQEIPGTTVRFWMICSNIGKNDLS